MTVRSAKGHHLRAKAPISNGALTATESRALSKHADQSKPSPFGEPSVKELLAGPALQHFDGFVQLFVDRILLRLG